MTWCNPRTQFLHLYHRKFHFCTRRDNFNPLNIFNFNIFNLFGLQVFVQETVLTDQFNQAAWARIFSQRVHIPALVQFLINLTADFKDFIFLFHFIEDHFKTIDSIFLFLDFKNFLKFLLLYYFTSCRLLVVQHNPRRSTAWGEYFSSNVQPLEGRHSKTKVSSFKSSQEWSLGQPPGVETSRQM